MRVIACLTQKGGAGKTTTVMGLAAAAADAGLRVLVVDTDAEQRSAAHWCETVGEDELPFDFAEEMEPEAIKGVRGLAAGGEYDLVIIDTPGTLGKPAAMAALEVADYVVLPSKPSTLDINPLLRTIKTVVEPRKVPYKVLLTMVKSGTRHDEAMARDTFAAQEVPVFKGTIRDSVHHGRAPALGLVITSYPSSGRAAADDYRAVMTQLLADWARSDNK